MIEWRSLTKKAFDALDREQAVVVLTCSPLEVHGPHLPLGADALQGEALVERVHHFLPERHRERTFLKLPLVFTASDVVAQAGSLHFSPRTTVRVLTELGATLAHQGFRHVVVSNFHGGKRHVLAIERACERVGARHSLCMVSLFSLMGQQLREAGAAFGKRFDGRHGASRGDFRGDTHAGVLETSQLLALHGEWVDPEYTRLPRRTLDDWLETGGDRSANPLRRIRALRSFAAERDYFVESSYSGAPAAASAELGREILDALAEPTATGLAEVLDGTRAPGSSHTPAWKRFLLLDPIAIRLTRWLLGQRSPIG